MANLNKVMLIGRLTRDPETRAFANGGKVVNFGFAVNNRRKSQSGQWEDEPVFLDCEAFNRGDYGKIADLVEQYLHKGSQAYIEGHLKLDQWTKDGQKMSKLRIVVDQVQFLDSKQNGQQGGQQAQQGDPLAQPPSQAYQGQQTQQRAAQTIPDADVPF